MKRTPLKRSATTIRRSPVRKKRPGPPRRSSRVLDEDYLDWIRTLACIICVYRYPGGGPDLSVQTTRSEAAHVGARGLSQKCSDREAMPLCTHHHHDAKAGHHGQLGKNFWKHYGLDRDKIIAELNQRYEQEKQ
jgi:hypothetical protein